MRQYNILYVTVSVMVYSVCRVYNLLKLHHLGFRLNRLCLIHSFVQCLYNLACEILMCLSFRCNYILFEYLCQSCFFAFSF